MISISRVYRIEAAHWLPNVADGHKCKKLHGHTYKIVVTVSGSGDDLVHPSPGMLMDFAELDSRVMPLLSMLDHTCLNDTISNPTAELLSAWLLSGLPFASSVRVYENDDCWAEVTK